MSGWLHVAALMIVVSGDERDAWDDGKDPVMPETVVITTKSPAGIRFSLIRQ